MDASHPHDITEAVLKTFLLSEKKKGQITTSQHVFALYTHIYIYMTYWGQKAAISNVCSDCNDLMTLACQLTRS